MFASHSIATRLFQQTVRRYHGGSGHFKPPTMDELPLPGGSWKARYDARQRHYNAVLVAGIAFAAGSLMLAKASGLVYLNYSPPKSID